MSRVAREGGRGRLGATCWAIRKRGQTPDRDRCCLALGELSPWADAHTAGSCDPSSQGSGWSPTGVGVPSVDPSEVPPTTGPCRDPHCPGGQMAAQSPFLGTRGMQKGPRTRGEEVPWRSVPAQGASPSALGGEHSQGLLSLPRSDQTPAVGVTWTRGSCPAHLTVYVVLLFSSSVFKKIFRQGEPPGHQSIPGSGAVTSCPTGLAGGGRGLGEWGDAFQGAFPLGFPQGLPCQAPGLGPPVLAP